MGRSVRKAARRKLEARRDAAVETAMAVAVDIETRGADGFTMNGDAIEFKSADLDALERRVFSGKAAAQIDQMAMHASSYSGRAIHDMWVDDAITPRGDARARAEAFVDPYCKRLSDDEWRWAVAFRAVLGVGHEFYSYAPYGRRHQLERHYKELAGHDTQKGRRAAKVVAIWTDYTIRRAAPSDLYRNLAGSMTGRSSSTPAAFAAMYGQNIPRVPNP